MEGGENQNSNSRLPWHDSHKALIYSTLASSSSERNETSLPSTVVAIICGTEPSHCRSQLTMEIAIVRRLTPTFTIDLVIKRLDLKLLIAK